MKLLSKLSILLLFVALAFCACDKNNGDQNAQFKQKQRKEKMRRINCKWLRMSKIS